MNVKPQGHKKNVMDGFKPKNRPDINNRKRFGVNSMSSKSNGSRGKGRMGGCSTCK